MCVCLLLLLYCISFFIVLLNYCLLDRIAVQYSNFFSCSVLINFYLRGTTDPTNPARQMPILSINTAFTEGIRISNIIRDFQGQRAIMISNSTYGMIDQNVHPGAFRRDGSRFNVEDDPVLNAIILGYWPRECVCGCGLVNNFACVGVGGWPHK